MTPRMPILKEGEEAMSTYEEIGMFTAAEGLDLAEAPNPKEVDAAWCLRCSIYKEARPMQVITKR